MMSETVFGRIILPFIVVDWLKTLRYKTVINPGHKGSRPTPWLKPPVETGSSFVHYPGLRASLLHKALR